ncbi:MAG: GntR family transcriptional regulator [Actinomyces ruminicola]|uniref:GntR family transcriptional regulator n=1 Tax=Actinomyces ruminicola TaxID=332524 RepID=UPI000B829202|nr:GntR family transcriptional regulator [Actinomyces ruminicola]MBE6481864.1 GntR family transcriptional regulator [Actinomyces ruminicola]
MHTPIPPPQSPPEPAVPPPAKRTARLDIHLDPTSTEPVFAQICAAVSGDIAAGRLPAGTRLPPTRTLATQLNIAVNTVAKAYRELEMQGYIEGRGRRGTFVRDQSGAAREREVMRFVTTMHSLGIPLEETLDLVRRAWP